MAVKRLQREWGDINNDMPTGCTASLENGNDLFNWSVSISGPETSPYYGGKFFLKMKFPEDYPDTPPQVQFVTKIYHPNISRKGVICLDILRSTDWSSQKDILTVGIVLTRIRELIEYPDPDDPIIPELAKLFRKDRDRFEENARENTKKYALEFKHRM